MSDHDMTADETINRQRFAQVKQALRDGRSCEGTCKVHALVTDAQILQLDSSEAILIDTRNLRVQFTALSNQVLAYMQRSNAVAGEQVEQGNTLEKIVKLVVDHPDMEFARAGGSRIAWLCRFGIALSAVVIVWLVTTALKG
jgi:hypothetical protein